jgi:ribosomal protein L37AE/L43A
MSVLEAENRRMEELRKLQERARKEQKEKKCPKCFHPQNKKTPRGRLQCLKCFFVFCSGLFSKIMKQEIEILNSYFNQNLKQNFLDFKISFFNIELKFSKLL